MTSPEVIAPPSTPNDTPAISIWMAYAEKLRQTAIDLCACAPASIETAENTSSHPKVLGVLLLCRTLGHLKSVLLLLRERQVIDSRILVRCSLENMLWIAALQADGPGFQKAMIDDEMRHRIMRGQTLLKTGVDLESEAEQKLRQFLRDNKQFAKVGTLNPKSVASDSTIPQAYVFYSDLSADSGHPSITSLSRHYVEEPNDARVIDIEPDPDEREIAGTMHLMCYALLTTLMILDNLLGGTAEASNIQTLASDYVSILRMMSEAP